MTEIGKIAHKINKNKFSGLFDQMQKLHYVMWPHLESVFI